MEPPLPWKFYVEHISHHHTPWKFYVEHISHHHTPWKFFPIMEFEVESFL